MNGYDFRKISLVSGQSEILFNTPQNIGNWWAYNTDRSKIVYSVQKKIFVMDSDGTDSVQLGNFTQDIWDITAGKVIKYTVAQ